MMAHKDTAAQRLLDEIELLKSQLAKESPIAKQDDIRFDDFATVPLPLAIEVAFDAVGLDRTDPLHWLQLMSIFALVHFGDRRGRGAPKRDRQIYDKLILDFSEVESRKPEMSHEAIFTILGKRAEYQTKKGRPLSTSRLRKMLKQAKDRERNMERMRLLCASEFDDGDLTELNEECEHKTEADSGHIGHNLDD
jgi:hypothetical protein